MAQMLLINPRGRRKARRAAPKRKRATRARARRVVRVIAANPSRRRVRRHRNPIGVHHRRVHHRRRRNPIRLGGHSAGLVAMLKTAAIGGAGSVAVDLLMGQLNKYLPASMVSSPDTVDVGDAVKAGVTIMLGRALNKSTRGLSQKMALGALTVQMAGILRTFVPASMALGYYSPGRIVRGTPRIGPNVALLNPGVHRYLQSGSSPVLNAYMPSGASQLLSRAPGGSSNLRMR
jgi:hypothetical protein